MADTVRQINYIAPTWNLLGFLVPEAQAERVGETLGCGYAVLGTFVAVEGYPDAFLAMEYNCGFPDRTCGRIVTLVAPTAFVASTARIGRGCVIYPHCFVGHNAILGDRVFVLGGSVINHDDVLKDDVTVGSQVSLAGFVHVEAGCYLGQACTVRQHLRIGRGSLVGMGSVVIADVPPNSVMIGNPARKLRDLWGPKTSSTGNCGPLSRSMVES
jgi:acetyltransferase-like isoleucine patch superfamily enzyme